MVSYQMYECTYVRDGVSKKEGPNQGRQYQTVQLKEYEEGKNGQYHGSYTHTLFVWNDEANLTFDVGSVYNCMILQQNGRSQLISVQE